MGGTRAGPEDGIWGAFHGTSGQHVHKKALGGVLMKSPGLIAGLLSRKGGLLDAGRDPLMGLKKHTLTRYFLDADVLYTFRQVPPPPGVGSLVYVLLMSV